MSKVPFMPLWVGDFLAKTLGLDAREAGAYLLLLMAMWTHGGKLPNDTRKLQRVARVGRDWPKVWAAIGHYFEADGDHITNARLREELHKACTKREDNARSGALGGRAKALKSKGEALANATVSLKQSYSYSEEEKKEKNPPTPQGGREIARRKTRIPPDAILSDRHREIATAKGLTDAEAEAQFLRFRDWACAKGQSYVDWDAAWRNWITSPHFKPITGGGHAPKRADDKLSAFIAGARR